MMKRSFALWTLGYLLSRLLLLATDSPALYSHDELYAGAAALELAAGRSLPWPLLAHVPYSGGPIVIAAVASLSFRLLGDHVLALRALSLLFSAGTFLLWLVMISRLFGRAAVHLTAILGVLAPPAAARLSVMALGNHSESSFWGTLALTCLVFGLGRDAGGLRGPDGDAGAWRTRMLGVLAGASGGFALFFSYGAVIYLLSTKCLWHLL